MACTLGLRVLHNLSTAPAFTSVFLFLIPTSVLSTLVPPSLPQSDRPPLASIFSPISCCPKS
ncbi:hypothetical protein M433DRAFT_147568 [Acidomyces richmondensis BFW]|nr:hypothetical protein M433DRAFT_147568 [Acidomyces richmondensis BFW]